MNLVERIQHYTHACHKAAVDGGWWHDLHTGERLNRNKGELICLMHSEISEAFEAAEARAMDDKLPHRPGVEVELADAAIRLFDYAGGFGYDLTACVWEEVKHASWATIHSALSKFMESERKGKKDAAERLAHVLNLILVKAEHFKADLWGAVDEKMIVNSKRADHKPEARRADGGKAF